MPSLYLHTSDVLRGGGAGLRVRLPLTVAGAAIYGAALGGFGGVTADGLVQSTYSAAKVPLLLFVAFAVSLPSFFVFNTLAGLRSDFADAVRALASAQAALAVVLASLAPYTLLWYASSDSYLGAQLFNGAMFAVATVAGQVVLRRRYRPLVERDARHRWMLAVWLTTYCFVAIQMAWVLRPFIGAPNQPPQFFRRDGWGNAYVILGRNFWNALTER